MIPKFSDLATWHQAEQLMQPAYIRLIDLLRQMLERSTWVGRYEEVPLWPEGVSEATKQQITQLQSQLTTATPAVVADIEQTLAQLPEPFPAYYLHLTRGDRTVTVDLWDLCYQVCFLNFPGTQTEAEPKQPGTTVHIDTHLFDSQGEVDWPRLNAKAQDLVQQLFASLPSED